MKRPDTFTLALAQMNPTVGDLAGNVAMMVDYAERAAKAGADLVLFPEMSVTGYPPEDLILVPSFRAAAMEATESFAKATASLKCDCLIGNLWADGTHIFNASLLTSGGVARLVRAKHNLPNYGVFDEKRVFQIGAAPEVLDWRGIKLGVLICEEVWDVRLPKALGEQGAEILLVQNASPYHIGKAYQRKMVVCDAVEKTGLPTVYLNKVGGQDELVFDGRSYAVGADGHDVARLPGFRESLGILRWERGGKNWVCTQGPMPETRPNDETIYHALVVGLRDYVTKNRFPGVVLGMSGGVDSAISAAIAVDALGADRVHGIRLPSPYTSPESLKDAEESAQFLGMKLDTLSIAPAMQAVSNGLAPIFAGRAEDTTEENIQARLRGLLLMAVSNKFGPMVLTTGNKSEMSVGYATLYGDMCGGFSVLKDVYKTTVYKLSVWRNSIAEADVKAMGLRGPAGRVIPERTITKPPTAELRPGQTDQDSLPPYDELDTILRGLIERQLGVAELTAEGMHRETVEKVARLVWAAEYKRRQSAPGVKITPMAFGRDRRWPITNRWQYK